MALEMDTTIAYPATVGTAGATTPAAAAPAAAEGALFESNSTVQETTGTKPSTSPDVQALQTELKTKEAEGAQIKADIKDNTAKLKTATTTLNTLSDIVKSAKSTFDQANLEYTAAKTQLDNLKNQNFFSRLFNGGQIKELEAKVAQLETKKNKAKKDWDKAVDNQQKQADKVTELYDNSKILGGLLSQNLEDVKEIKDKIAKATQAGEETSEPAPAEGGEPAAPQAGEETNPEEPELDEDVQAALAAAQGGTTGTPAAGTSAGATAGMDPEVAQALQEAQAAMQEAQAAVDVSNNDRYVYETYEQTYADAFLGSTDFIDFGRIFGVFGEGLSFNDFQFMGLSLLGVQSQVQNYYNFETTSVSYAKSSGVALGDTASSEEHSEAEAAFMDVVLTVSDAFNSGDVEFSNFADESNFNMAMTTLGKINEGEYIRTDLLKKQTVSAQGIKFESAVQTADQTEEERYEAYSNAILGEIEFLTEQNPFGESVLSTEAYQAIEARYSYLAATNPEAAFEYLQEQAGKYGITEAVAA